MEAVATNHSPIQVVGSRGTGRAEPRLQLSKGQGRRTATDEPSGAGPHDINPHPAGLPGQGRRPVFLGWPKGKEPPQPCQALVDPPVSPMWTSGTSTVNTGDSDHDQADGEEHDDDVATAGDRDRDGDDDANAEPAATLRAADGSDGDGVATATGCRAAKTAPGDTSSPAGGSTLAPVRRIASGIRARIVIGYLVLMTAALGTSVVIARQVQSARIDREVETALVQEADELAEVAASGAFDIRSLFDEYLNNHVAGDHEAFYTIPLDAGPDEDIARSFGAPMEIVEDADLIGRWASSDEVMRGTFDTPVGETQAIVVPIVRSATSERLEVVDPGPGVEQRGAGPRCVRRRSFHAVAQAGSGRARGAAAACWTGRPRRHHRGGVGAGRAHHRAGSRTDAGRAGRHPLRPLRSNSSGRWRRARRARDDVQRDGRAARSWVPRPAPVPRRHRPRPPHAAHDRERPSRDTRRRRRRARRDRDHRAQRARPHGTLGDRPACPGQGRAAPLPTARGSGLRGLRERPDGPGGGAPGQELGCRHGSTAGRRGRGGRPPPAVRSDAQPCDERRAAHRGRRRDRHRRQECCAERSSHVGARPRPGGRRRRCRGAFPAFPPGTIGAGPTRCRAPRWHGARPVHRRRHRPRAHGGCAEPRGVGRRRFHVLDRDPAGTAGRSGRHRTRP